MGADRSKALLALVAGDGKILHPPPNLISLPTPTPVRYVVKGVVANLHFEPLDKSSMIQLYSLPASILELVKHKYLAHRMVRVVRGEERMVWEARGLM